MVDFGTQRMNMVESQVRPSDVTDRRIIRAMSDLAREAFVPDWARATAYADEETRVARANGGAPARFLLAPRTLAKLVQLAEIEATDRILDVGCATGYSTALLARLGADVVGLEEDADLASAARAALEHAKIGTARIEQGALSQGWAASAPYDLIVLEGSVPEVPAGFLAQLKDGGRLVAVLTPASARSGPGSLGMAYIFHKAASGLASRAVFDAGAPPLPGFARAAGFTL